MRAKPPPEFKNVDLEIVSRSKLDAIEAAVDDKAHALFCGPIRRGVFLLALECNSYPKDADAAITKLCAAVEGLGKSERQLWERALRRTFDVGYGITPGSRAAHVALRPETLRRVSALGATVAFTCYLDDSEPGSPANGSQPFHSETNSTSSAASSRR
ncbi:MAG: hypothetical protein LR011_13985 [Verrucomicrobia bacterium]|nr:hypothetical protein [Verrucomicrobiota bacterium]